MVCTATAGGNVSAREERVWSHLQSPFGGRPDSIRREGSWVGVDARIAHPSRILAYAP